MSKKSIVVWPAPLKAVLRSARWPPGRQLKFSHCLLAAFSPLFAFSRLQVYVEAVLRFSKLERRLMITFVCHIQLPLIQHLRLLFGQLTNFRGSSFEARATQQQQVSDIGFTLTSSWLKWLNTHRTPSGGLSQPNYTLDGGRKLLIFSGCVDESGRVGQEELFWPTTVTHYT